VIATWASLDLASFIDATQQELVTFKLERVFAKTAVIATVAFLVLATLADETQIELVTFKLITFLLKHLCY
jgi:hypothetical protein